MKSPLLENDAIAGRRGAFPWREAMALAALALAVGAAAYLSIELTRDNGRIAAIWPANAIVVAGLMNRQRREWPAVLAAGLAGCLGANLCTGDSLSAGLGLGIINQAEALICALGCRPYKTSSLEFFAPRRIGLFLCAAAGAASASAVAAALLLAQLFDAPIWASLQRWVAADFLGLVVVTPALLAISTQSLRGMMRDVASYRGLLALAAACVGVGAMAALFHRTHQPVLFMLMPAVALCGYLFSPGALAMVMLGVAMITIQAGLGLPALTAVLPQLETRIMVLQLFLAVSTLTALTLSSTLARLREANARLGEARDAAEVAARVKSEFASNMSHEIRTPLTAILGFTDALASRDDLEPEARRQVRRIADAGAALLEIVNDVLDFSKLEAGGVVLRSRPTRPQAAIEAALELVALQAADKGLELQASTAGLPGWVRLDPDRFRQVLLNLLGNAIKFTESGRVALSARYDAKAGRLHVSVSDTGPGIAPQEQEKLFQRFSQLDGSSTKQHGGTGLGLAISRALVELMGGEIGVSSRPGDGATFQFTIDAPACGPGESAVRDGRPASALEGLRVLVVDDNPANRELVGAMLAAAGVEAKEAPDGQTAVELAHTIPFDAILMDLRMPGLDGETAMRSIRDAAGPNAGAPILAFTADHDLRQSDGFDGAIRKPVDHLELLTTLGEAIARSDA